MSRCFALTFDKHMKVGIIVAFDEEIDILRGHMRNVAERESAGVRITGGVLAGHEVFLSLSGIGKTNAAATTQLIICECKPDMLLNIGFAGSCCDLPIGGAVVVDKLVYHDFRMDFAAESPPYTEFYTPDAQLLTKTEEALKNIGIKCMRGTCATGDQFIGEHAVKNNIVLRTHCACVEMEGAAFAHVAQKNRVPFACVKVVSDRADESAHDEFLETVTAKDYSEMSARFVTELASIL